MINKCTEHSEFDFRLENIEMEVANLRKKWERLQTWITGIAVTVILNLVGIIIILLTK